jgi:catechol 2,3-dioxygenase-like lactoylglutathione lyase family enzyme
VESAIRFYVDTLGLRLTNRIGDRWATVHAGPSYWTSSAEVGAGLPIAFQPAQAGSPAPGTKGSVMFGFETYSPIEQVVEWMQQRGVRVTSEIIRFEAGNVVSIEDFDGNPTYVQEWTPGMLEAADRGTADKHATTRSMLAGGHALIFVSNMDRSVQFYRDALGMNLTYRFEDKFATVEARGRLLIGLHPVSEQYPAPGTRGAITLALQTDEPVERVVAMLASKGVRLLGGKTQPQSRSFVEFEDPDGNVIVLTEAGAESESSTAGLPVGAVSGQRGW